MTNETTPRAPARPQSTDDNALLWRNIGKWTIAFLLFLALSAMFLSLVLLQVTAEGTSKRTLRRSVAALTEIDTLVDRQYDALQEQAGAAKEDEGVRVEGFPIAVSLAPTEVRGASRQQLRDLLLDRSADVLYEEGSGALRDSAVTSGSVSRFSVGGLTKHGLGFLRSRNHDVLVVSTIVLAVLSALLAGALAMLGRGFGRLGAIGGTVLVAASPLATLGIGTRFYARVLSDGDASYIEREFLEIGQALAWIPIRDGLAFVVFGAACVAVAVGCGLWADRRRDVRAAYAGAHSRAR